MLKQGTLVSVWGTAKVTKGRYRVCFKVSRTPYAFGWDDTTPLTVGVQLRGQEGKLNAIKDNVKVNQLSPFDWRKIHLEENVPDGADEIKLFLLEINQAKWKAGLKIRSVTVEKIAQSPREIMIAAATLGNGE